MLTITDLDKLDDLNDEVIAAIKTAKFSADYEVYLRSEFANFMAKISDVATPQTTNVYAG
jgi:hypothetical protein